MSKNVAERHFDILFSDWGGDFDPPSIQVKITVPLRATTGVRS